MGRDMKCLWLWVPLGHKEVTSSVSSPFLFSSLKFFLPQVETLKMRNIACSEQVDHQGEARDHGLVCLTMARS